jgi:hypothetical protein
MSEMATNGTFCLAGDDDPVSSTRPGESEFASMLGCCISVQPVKFEEVDARTPASPWKSRSMKVG